MSKFTIIVTVECDTLMQAQTVMEERLEYDEQYDDPETGEPFTYRLDWQRVEVDPIMLTQDNEYVDEDVRRGDR